MSHKLVRNSAEQRTGQMSNRFTFDWSSSGDESVVFVRHYAFMSSSKSNCCSASSLFPGHRTCSYTCICTQKKSPAAARNRHKSTTWCRLRCYAFFFYSYPLLDLQYCIAHFDSLTTICKKAASIFLNTSPAIESMGEKEREGDKKTYKHQPVAEIECC